VFAVIRQPRWIGLALVVLLIVSLCLLAARWQWHRRESRLAHNALVNSHLAAQPVAPQHLLSVDAPLPADDEYAMVTATGSWDPGHQVLARNHLGRAGYDVLTPFVTGSGPALLVDRGWIPLSEQGAGSAPDVPQPTTGDVSIVVRMRQTESPRSTDNLPPGQVYAIDVPAIAGGLPYPVYGGYGELVSQDPSLGSTPVLPDAPDLSTGPHLIYAIQWTCFALIALVGYGVLVRREVLERRARVSAGQPVTTG
jgi:cytochrome oxidase assembly protein ShyY1